MTTRKRTYKKRIYPKKAFGVEDVCKKSGFLPADKTVGGFVPDFIKRDGKLIIEIGKDGRNSQERVNAFYKHGYKVLFIAGDILIDPKNRKYAVNSIRGFAK